MEMAQIKLEATKVINVYGIARMNPHGESPRFYISEDAECQTGHSHAERGNEEKKCGAWERGEKVMLVVNYFFVRHSAVSQQVYKGPD